ncbi:MAG: HDOD domain-containing protein [Ketobacter sp.]|nr:MAG: HDOD domain-containing protein [Ketobacter sp.]
MASAFQAKGLQYWVSELAQAVLPILPGSAVEIRRLLEHPDTSLNQIGDLVAQDPVLRLHVLRACNNQFAEKAAGTLSNPHHCVSMLGMDNISALVDSLKPDCGANNRFEPRYLQAIIQSSHAAELALSWLPFRHQGNADQLVLACLLYGVPDWAMWRVASNEARMIDALVQQQRVPVEEAELAVLGCQRAELAKALAQHWHFSDQVCGAIHGAPIPSPAFLMRYARLAQKHSNDAASVRMPNKTEAGLLAHSQGFTVHLSNTLAQQSARSWYSKPTLRCQAIVAAYLDQPLVRILELTKSVALETSRRFAIVGVQSPAEGLLWPQPSAQRRRIKPSQMDAAVTKMASMLGQGSVPAKAPKSATPAPPSQRPDPLNQPRAIGIKSEKLPDGLDHHAIRSAPKPAAKPAAVFPGFVSAEKYADYETLINKLLHQPSAFSSEQEALRSITDCLYRCTELERVVVAVLNPERSKLEAYYAQGCSEAPALQRFTVQLQPPNLFTQLLRQPAATWISRERQQQIEGVIPGQFRQASQCEDFFLMSVFNQQGAYGLFYADRGLTDRIGLSEAEYKIFKSTGAHCSKYLMALQP